MLYFNMQPQIMPYLLAWFLKHKSLQICEYGFCSSYNPILIADIVYF